MPKYKKAAGSLAVCRISLTFAAMTQISNHHTTKNETQKKVCFSASFNALYLHTPEKSVTHTHTHTHIRTASRIIL